MADGHGRHGDGQSPADDVRGAETSALQGKSTKSWAGPLTFTCRSEKSYTHTHTLAFSRSWRPLQDDPGISSPYPEASAACSCSLSSCCLSMSRLCVRTRARARLIYSPGRQIIDKRKDEANFSIGIRLKYSFLLNIHGEMMHA